MNRTVLFVDDDPNLLAGIKRALRTQPYRVLTAERPAAAISVVESQPVDVVVADYRMPGMNGVELAARVHASSPSTTRILLTGCANLEVAMDAINEGHVDSFFTKPCQLATLTASIRRALNQKDACDLESVRAPVSPDLPPGV